MGLTTGYRRDSQRHRTARAKVPQARRIKIARLGAESRMDQPPWTQSEDKILDQAVQMGVSLEDMARVLGRTHIAVRNHLRLRRRLKRAT